MHQKELVPLTGYYIDETLPVNGPFPKSRWQTVKFHGMFPTIIIGGEGDELLHAWAKTKRIGKLLNDSCTICKQVPCCC